MSSHRIDYLRFSYSPEYARQQNLITNTLTKPSFQMGVHDKIWSGFHLLQQIQPDIQPEEVSEKGMHGFTHSLKITREGVTVGYIAAGGNHGKVLVDLSGKGCLEVDWEKAYQEIDRVGARLTRVDVCLDDFEGKHSVDEVREAYHKGLFDKRGQHPMGEAKGAGWEDTNRQGEGRSYYIGNPKNGLGFVAYEKGKQLGDTESPWVRHEARWARTGKKEIPMDILLDPYAYLKAAYQYLEWAGDWPAAESTHMHITSETIQLKELIHWAKSSYGKLVNVLGLVGHSAEQIVKIMRAPGKPQRLMLRPQDYEEIILC